MNKEIEEALNTIFQNSFVNCKDARELREIYNSYKSTLEQTYHQRLAIIKDKDYYADCYMQVIKESYGIYIDKVATQTDSNYAKYCFDHIKDIADYKKWEQSSYVKALLQDMYDKYNLQTEYEIVMTFNPNRMNDLDNAIGYWITRNYDDMDMAYKCVRDCVYNEEIISVIKELAEKEKEEYLSFCEEEVETELD